MDGGAYGEGEPRAGAVVALAGLVGDAGVDGLDVGWSGGLARAGEGRVDKRLEIRREL